MRLSPSSLPAALRLTALTVKDLVVTGDLKSSQPHITTSLMSSGPPPAPRDGDIWIATAVDANGTRWKFQYNAQSSSSFKWEFIGGSPLIGAVAGSVTTTTTGFVDLTGGPTLAAPRNGDYYVRWGVQPDATAFTATFFAQTIAAFGANTSPTCSTGMPQQWIGSPVTQGVRFNNQALGDTLKIRVQNDRAGGGTTTWNQGWLEVIPVRIS